MAEAGEVEGGDGEEASSLAFLVRALDHERELA